MKPPIYIELKFMQHHHQQLHTHMITYKHATHTINVYIPVIKLYIKHVLKGNARCSGTYMAAFPNT